MINAILLVLRLASFCAWSVKWLLCFQFGLKIGGFLMQRFVQAQGQQSLMFVCLSQPSQSSLLQNLADRNVVGTS